MQIISSLIEAHIFREINGEVEFLLLKRSDSEIYPGLWQMVTGKIDKGEKAFIAALREIKEETGLEPEQFWVAPKVNSFYEPNDDYVCMIPVFAARVKENSKVIISEEHSQFKWLKPDKAKKLLAWPGQREAVDIITDYFIKEISFLKFVEIKI